MTDVISDLRRELNRLREHLLSGNLDILDESAANLARLDADLRRTTPPLDDIDAIRTQARQVARLLQEAGKGVRSGLRRVAALSEPAPPFSPYGADGRREVPIDHPSFAQRA